MKMTKREQGGITRLAIDCNRKINIPGQQKMKPLDREVGGKRGTRGDAVNRSGGGSDVRTKGEKRKRQDNEGERQREGVGGRKKKHERGRKGKGREAGYWETGVSRRRRSKGRRVRERDEGRKRREGKGGRDRARPTATFNWRA